MLRNNYFVQVDGDLPWSASIGDEDGELGSFGWFTARPDKPVKEMFFQKREAEFEEVAQEWWGCFYD